MENHEYKPAPLRIKIIRQPKLRRAQVPSLEDKIVQHVVCDNYAYKQLTKSFIKETSACIINRGTDYARELLKKQLSEFYRKKHIQPYILKLDIKSYFATIPHERCKKLFDRYIIDEDIKYILNSFLNLTDIGLPLGLQQSQIMANLYLSEMDHLIKEKYHCRWYGRYMDDFYIISDDKEFLLFLWKEIEEYLYTIGLELNPKTTIKYNKVEFLGFNFKLTETGKVIKTLATGKKKTKEHHLKKLAEELALGEKTAERVADSYFGWRQHAKKGQTRNALLAMDRKFNGYLQKYGYHLEVGVKGEVKIWEELLEI